MKDNHIETVVIQNNAESILRIVANIILVVGVINAIICAFNLCWVQDPNYTQDESAIFNPTGLVFTLFVALGSFAAWALLNVIANISAKLTVIASHFEETDSQN